jgi:succinate dehydrogenase/fumarate reductase cytochrome b subunit
MLPPKDDLINYLVLGLMMGAVVSVFLKKNAKPGKSKQNALILGTDSSILIRNIMIFVIAAGFTGLLGLSTINSDLEYIIEKPENFATEIALIAILPSLVVFAMTILRGHKVSSTTWMEFFALACKFGLMHVLLQISGFYRYVYPPLEPTAL